MNPNTQTADTTPDAENVLLELVRNQPPTLRLQKMLSLTDRVREQCRAAIRRRFPTASEDELRLKFIEINYGNSLAEAVRTWRDSGSRR